MTPELLNDVGQAMVDSVPDGWKRITLDITGAGNLVRGKMAVTMNDGTVNTRVALDRAGARSARLFREGSHEDGTGTWYNAHIEVGDDLKITADYDYDQPPLGGLSGQGGQANEEVLRKDQEMFPRSPENLPEWHPSRTEASA